MVVGLYVHAEFNRVTVDTEEEHQERIEEAFREAITETYNDDFQAFLEDGHNLVEVFFMSEEERKQIMEDFKFYFFDNFDEREEWEYIEKVIEG